MIAVVPYSRARAPTFVPIALKAAHDEDLDRVCATVLFDYLLATDRPRPVLCMHTPWPCRSALKNPPAETNRLLRGPTSESIHFGLDTS